MARFRGRARKRNVRRPHEARHKRAEADGAVCGTAEPISTLAPLDATGGSNARAL
jgi:hypothetical protein